MAEIAPQGFLLIGAPPTPPPAPPPFACGAGLSLPPCSLSVAPTPNPGSSGGRGGAGDRPGVSENRVRQRTSLQTHAEKQGRLAAGEVSGSGSVCGGRGDGRRSTSGPCFRAEGAVTWICGKDAAKALELGVDPEFLADERGLGRRSRRKSSSMDPGCGIVGAGVREADLPGEVRQILDKLLDGKYIEGTVKAIEHLRNHSIDDHYVGVLSYLQSKGTSLHSLQTSYSNYFTGIVRHPGQLAAELRQMETGIFLLSVRYLYSDESVEVGATGLEFATIDFKEIRESILESPGGSRSLFVTVWERCLPRAGSPQCLELLTKALRLSSAAYLQPDLVVDMPQNLPEETFKNITAVFKELYDDMTARSQRAIYEWIRQILRRPDRQPGGSGGASWIVAENLWFLGRFVVHLPPEEIQKISLNEIRIFINYDNATKQLDSVYDITPGTARAFQERINASGFNMANTSTVYRLGLLVCFFDNVQELDTGEARSLLHQMIKCSRLKGFQADVRKLKAQLLGLVLRSQQLNETLDSISDAIACLSFPQLDSLSSESVRSAVSILGAVSGWSRSQTVILADKFIGGGEQLSAFNLSQLGVLVPGIGAHTLYNTSPKDLAQAVRGALSQHEAQLSVAQRLAVVTQATNGDPTQCVVVRDPDRGPAPQGPSPERAPALDRASARRPLGVRTLLWATRTGNCTALVRGNETGGRVLLMLVYLGVVYALLLHCNSQQSHLQHRYTSIANSRNVSSMLDLLNTSFLKEMPLYNLLALKSYNISHLDQELRRSQALFLYDLASDTMPVQEIISCGELARGLTCDGLWSLDRPTFLRLRVLFQRNLALLSPHQLNCLAWRYLQDAPDSMPPLLLVTLPTRVVASSPRAACRPLLIALGGVELASLVPDSAKRAEVIGRALWCLNYTLQDEYDLDVLGRTICDLPPEIIRTNISNKAMNEALIRFKICRDLSPAQKREVRNKIREFYGDPTVWQPELMQDLGPLVTLLSKEDLTTVAEKFPDILLQAAVEVKGAAISQDFLWAVFRALERTSGSIKPSDGAPGCRGVRTPSSDHILKLADANSYWSAQELRCLSPETFVRSVELLGTLKGFDIAQLVALKEKAKEVWGPVRSWRNHQVRALGRIALSLSEAEIEELDLGTIDTVAALSQHGEWSPLQVRSMLEGFLQDSGLTVGALDGWVLAGLGSLLCAMTGSEVNSISAAAYRVAAARVGETACGAEVQREMLKKARKVFGDVVRWKGFILWEVGTVAAGMSQEEIKHLNQDLMSYFKPEAIAALPTDVFKELSPGQLSSLGPENAAAVTEAQRAVLNPEQTAGLQAARDGGESKDTPPSTSPVTGSACRGELFLLLWAASTSVCFIP
ncbi:otoancorin-like [Pristis pectinata]|uniref:otoancorin-like n=1 Tax=Pristis pectinata TaxID=685728 RepID=UPI00223E8179|nr:otoancorin-like [Pristis pectinata]